MSTSSPATWTTSSSAAFAGALDLGFYDRAYKLLLFPIQNINAPLSRIMILVAQPGPARQATLQGICPSADRLDGCLLHRSRHRSRPRLHVTTYLSMSCSATTGNRSRRSLRGWVIAGLVRARQQHNGLGLHLARARPRPCSGGACMALPTTIAAFLIGLPWGAVGVAAAYAISTYVFEGACAGGSYPSYRADLGRRLPPSTQFLFVASSIATWVIFKTFPAVFLGNRRLACRRAGGWLELHACRAVDAGASRTKT